MIFLLVYIKYIIECKYLTDVSRVLTDVSRVLADVSRVLCSV